MKTVLAFNGSPRGAKGNTEKILQPFLEGMRDAGASVETLYLKDLDIKECRGCYNCHMKTPGRCIMSDDMDWIGERIKAADVLVFATPLYVFTVSALMKLLMDRFIIFGDLKLSYTDGLTGHPPRDPDKKWEWVLISNAGFPEREHFTALELTFEKFAWAFGGGTHASVAARILKGMGEILTVKKLLPQFEWFFQACRQAGREVAEQGRIAPETQEILDRPFIDLPVEQLVSILNQNIDKAQKLIMGKG
ncbi:MAG: flavodoxin family protein [Deltaproteobacteria bacterium]|nr:flavodoxin family protein [Deltaproteobacteria bacterium]